MEAYWLKQKPEQPLFENILWARPETKHSAGKLLIAGGNVHSFAAVQEAYIAATKAGAGHIRLVLPVALRRTVGTSGPYDYAPSTTSGSFSKDALNELLQASSWSDMVLLSGDLGRNSETAILLENFVKQYKGPLTITGDAVDYFFQTPQTLVNRLNTTVVLSLAQLQKLGTALKFETPFLHGMGTLLLVQALHTLTGQYPANIVTSESGNSIVASQGAVSSTLVTHQDAASAQEHQLTAIAARASVFWMQHLAKPFEAITSSLI